MKSSDDTAAQLAVTASGPGYAIGPDTSAYDAFSALASAQIASARLLAHALHTSASAQELHRFRVSVRRLRSLIWAYLPLMRREHARRWMDELKALAEATGRTRDWDVLLEGLLARLKVGRKARQSITQNGRGLREAELRLSRALLEPSRIEPLFDTQLRIALESMRSEAHSMSVRHFARQRLAAAERQVTRRGKRIGKKPAKQLTALHQTRIAVKKLRYLSEFFQPVLDEATHGAHDVVNERLTSLQTRLGDLNDLVASAQLVRARLAPSLKENAAKSLHKMLIKRAHRQSDPARKQVRRFLRAL